MLPPGWAGNVQKTVARRLSTHSPVSIGWERPSVCSSSWRRSSFAHWTAQLHHIWLQTCDDVSPTTDMPSRRRLRFSLTHQLDVHQSRCTTVGDRAFAVAGSRLVCHRTFKVSLRNENVFVETVVLLFSSSQFYLWSLRFLLTPR